MTAQKWSTVKGKNRSDTTKNNVSAAICLQIACLPLMFSSLKIINYLLLVLRSVWAKERSAIAVSFVDLQHTAGGSLPCQPVPPLASLAPLGKLISGLRHSAGTLLSYPHTGVHFQRGQEDARRAAGGGERPTTPAGLSCYPSTCRGKVRCFFTPGFSQERRQWHVGTTSLLDTNKWGQLSQSKQANRSAGGGKNAPFGFAAILHVRIWHLDAITVDATVQLPIESQLLSPFLALGWCHFIDTSNTISFACG